MALPEPSLAPVEPADFAEAVLATTPAFVIAFDERLRYANPAAVRVWGHELVELLDTPLDRLLHRDSRRAAAELVAGLGEPQGMPREVELRIRRRDGRHRRLRLAVNPSELRGRPVVLATGLDATAEHRTRQSLTRSEESLALVQRAARSVYWEWEPEGDRLSVTRFADELFGFSVHQVARTGAEFLDLVHPDDRERLHRALVATLKHGENLAIELRFITPPGEVRWLSERGIAVRDEDGRTRRIIGVAHDVSERKIAEEALFLEKDKADVTLASIADGVLRTDERGMIDYLNPVAQRLTGWSLAEAYGRPAEEVYRVVDAETGERLDDPLTRCLRERHQSIFADDRELADRGGELHPVQDSAAPIRNRGGEVIGAVLVFRDLSRMREIERQIDRLSSHDPLTGLINRRAFAAELERALAEARTEGRRHALCHLDLDNFRLVNETGGEAAGDRLIQQTASLIRDYLGAPDVVAHFGSDAFGVLFRDATPERAYEQADEIRRAVRAARFEDGARTFSTAVSVGVVALGPEPIDPTALLRDAQADGAAALLRDADAACLVAKERGGNRIHSYQPGDSAVAERYGQMQWISRITEAFDEDRFVLYHQSIVSLQGGESEGPPLHELLVRLVDENGELVGPGSFIPAAERFGMIAQIDRWVLRNALQVLADASAPGDGAEPRFTLNVSGFSLGAADFLDLVIAELDSTGVDPARVLFEITETAAIADLARARRFLSALKNRGCRFILDDFGKGLSSLGYLRNLPLDYLKIDGSFVRNMTVDPIQTALVASIHEIGDVMGLQTIAESVEDEDTLEAVRRIGIDYAQGFLLARPEPLLGSPVAAARPAKR